MNLGVLLLALPTLIAISGCALVFNPPMTEDEFVEADRKCDLDGATLHQGNFFKANPSIIEVPVGIRPSEWDDKVACVAKVFGGDGVSKGTTNSFEFRFTN